MRIAVDHGTSRVMGDADGILRGLPLLCASRRQLVADDESAKRTNRDHAVERLRPAAAYTAGTGLAAWSSPTSPCGTGPFTFAFNQGEHRPARDGLGSGGVAMAGSALLAWSASVPEGAKMGYQITAPPGITINNVVYDVAQLQNIADSHGWIGLVYWNGGLRRCIPTGLRSTLLPPAR